MATNRADRLLCCAVSYRNAQPWCGKLPDRFGDEKAGVDAMMAVLWSEAGHSMAQHIHPPEDTYLHPVDIDTDEPGIVATKNKKTPILRRKLPLPSVTYERTPPQRPPMLPVPPPLKMDAATKHAALAAEKHISSCQRQARKQLKAEEKAVERQHAMEEKKRQRAEETPEERALRLEEQRMKRAAKKAARELDQGGPHEEASEVAREEPEPSSGKEETSLDPAEGALSVQQLLESDADADTALHKVLPAPVRARGKKNRFFASPVPHDRHLTALERVELNPTIRDAVLQGTPSTSLRIIHGPPGTGKTVHIANLVEAFSNDRILACAPTNVGAANLYSRILEREAEASLILPASRIPIGTPVTSQDPDARVVCSTISGRAGPVLDGHSFGVVIVDEAAQCMEAWIWCLLREEVHTLILVGDTHQLPALVSQEGAELGHSRSLMQRLQGLQYPCTFLNTQRRMHPEIVAFPNREFYGNALETAYRATSVAVSPYMVIDVKGECEELAQSFVNRAEVDACIALEATLSAHFERVVIISPYAAQTRELLARNAKHVHTVDSYQGQEADAVIVSMVRNEEIGFWKDYRRLNVALTRARHCLRVVGSVGRWTGTLERLASDAINRGLCTEHLERDAVMSAAAQQ